MTRTDLQFTTLRYLKMVTKLFQSHQNFQLRASQLQLNPIKTKDIMTLENFANEN